MNSAVRLSFKAKFTFFRTFGSYEQCMRLREKTSNAQRISAFQTHTKWVFGSAAHFHVCIFFFPSAWTVTLHEFTVHESQALFTYLKTILLQCFQFSVSAKISCIQSDPKCAFTTTQFFFHLTVHLLFIVFYYYKAVGDGLME